MNNIDHENTNLINESKNNKGNTLSGLFAFIGFIFLSIGLMMYLLFIIFLGLDFYYEELRFWLYGSMALFFIAISLNIVSLVYSIMEFNNKSITRDRLFVHISLLIFNFLMLLSYIF